MPLIVYPYISRVLGVEKIGTCDFVDSIINYFVLFSYAGISSYGVREVARCKSDRKRLDSCFSSLVSLNILMTLAALAILILCVLFVPKFQDYSKFLWVGALKLIFSTFLIEWFYQGTEQFKYITIRTVAIRFVFIISVFIFVHSAQDVFIYFVLYSFTTVVNAVINWTYSRKSVTFILKKSNLREKFKPVFSFGYYRILTSLYTSFNTVFLGFVCTVVQVGYFATATKLNSILMSIFTAFTTVMVPHVSHLLEADNREELTRIGSITLNMLSIFSLPLIYFCLIFAPEIIFIISGRGYEGAIIPFRIIIPLILIIGFEQIYVQQFLMASTKSNKPIVLLSTVGAIVGLTINFIITPRLQSIGASISWVCSEICILLISINMVARYLGIKFSFIPILKTIIWSFAYIIPLCLIQCSIEDIWIKIPFAVIVVIVEFVLINFCLQSIERFPVKMPHGIENILKHMDLWKLKR